MTLTDVARYLILFCVIANVSGHSAQSKSATCSEEGDPPVPETADRSLLHQRRWLWWGDSRDDSEQPHGEGKLDKFGRNYTSDAHNPMDAAAAKGLTDNEALSGKNHETAESSGQSKSAKDAPAIAQGPAATPENDSDRSHNHGKLDSFDRDYLADANNPMDAAAAKGLTDNEALSGKNHVAADSTGKPEPKDTSSKEEPPAAPSAPATKDAPAPTQVPAPAAPAPGTEVPAAATPAPPEGALAKATPTDTPDETPTNSTNETPTNSPPNTTTETTTTLGHTVPLCGTRSDPSVSKMSLYYTVAPEDTPCVFGVDARDEGAHCIFEDIKYGAFGWCWTNVQMDSWGSCNKTCPLFGPLKVLEDKIDDLRRSLAGSNLAPSNPTA